MVASHFMFADDTLLFCERKVRLLKFLRCILMCFETISGLRVNLRKIESIPIGEVEGILDLAASIGCSVGGLPSSYLGLPLGAKTRSRLIWDPVVERFSMEDCRVEASIPL